MADLTVGDQVTVTGMDGEESEAVVCNDPLHTCATYTIERSSGQEVSLAEYWRGHDVDEDEAVVEIRYVKGVSVDGEPLTYSKGTYGFPISKVEVDDA